MLSLQSLGKSSGGEWCVCVCVCVCVCEESEEGEWVWLSRCKRERKPPQFYLCCAPTQGHSAIY